MGGVENTRRIAEPYFEDHDVEALAPDVSYTIAATGEEIDGREGVAEMLSVFYEDVFDASAEITGTYYGDGFAVEEFVLRGKHVGEFNGMPATGRTVEMPACLVVEVGDEHIERARLYPQFNRLFDQLAE